MPLKEETTWQATYHTVDTPERFAAFLEELKRQTRFCIDTETTAIDPLRAELVGLSFCWQAGEAYYLPVRGPAGRPVLDEATTLAALGPILADPAIEKVGQNIKYDMLALGRAGVVLAGPVTDTMVLSYLLESGERNHNLDQLSQRLLDHTMIPITDLIGKGKNQSRMDQVAVDRVAEYAGEDADATWRIETILTAKVRDEGLWTLYAELERPLIAVLAGMEAAGVAVDVGRLRQLSRRVRRADRRDRDRGLCAGRPYLQHQFRPPASPGAVRRAETPLAAKDSRRRAEHGPGRFGRAGPQAPLSPLCSCSIVSYRSSRARTWTHCPSSFIPATAGSMRRSIRASRQPGGCPRATLTCKISRCAPRTAARFARRLSPADAGTS